MANTLFANIRVRRKRETTGPMERTLRGFFKWRIFTFLSSDKKKTVMIPLGQRVKK